MGLLCFGLLDLAFCLTPYARAEPVLVDFAEKRIIFTRLTSQFRSICF